MRWEQFTEEAKQGMFRLWEDENHSQSIVEEMANHYQMNWKTLARRLQEMKKAEYSDITEEFPDKKISIRTFKGILDQIKNVQAYKKDQSVSQDEATWIPKRSYPNLPIAITWMSDIHFGSLETDYDLLERHLDIIRNTPNMYTMFGGDEIDNFNAVKYADGIWHDGVTPEDQMVAWADILEDLNDEKKIAAIVWGNHTQFSAIAGIDPYSAFFSHVSAPIFSDGGGVLNVVLGGVKYRLGLRHTFWGGSKLNITNAAKKMIQFGYPNLDAGFLGHTHDAAGETFTLSGEEKIAVQGGTYKLNDSFRKRWGNNPNAAGFTIMLYSDKKKMILFRDPEDARQFLRGLM